MILNRIGKCCILGIFLALQTPALFAQQQKPATYIQSIRYDATDNSPRSILFKTEARVPLSEAPAILQEQLHLHAGTDKMEPATATPGDKGITVQRYQQQYQGLPVEHGSFAVMAKDGVIRMMNGRYYPVSAPLSAQPGIDEAAALNKALDWTGAQRYFWQEAGKRHHRLPGDPEGLPKGALVWVEDFSSGKADGQLHLAYKFDIYATRPLSRNWVFVDAQSGKILFSDAIIKHIAASASSLYSGTVSIETDYDANTGGYVLNDLTRGNGVFTYTLNNGDDLANASDIANATTTWPASAGIDAHWGAEMVYDYWSQQHGRYSYDGQNTEMINAVNYDVDYDNAFWSGYYMAYGDGSGIANGGFRPMVSLDIAAHEIGHGVCQTTCNLVYAGESGALNEGLSDIWGATIEHWANPNEVDSQAKETWEIGEEVGVTPLRSMANPKLYGNPDCYNGINWTNTVNCTPSNFNDQCGVHNNSSVLNHWYYLLVNGGSGTNDLGNAFQVAGINIDDAANIVYSTELMLSSTADYTEFRSVSENVAAQLFGSCTPQFESLERAWYAVGVGSNFVPCTPQISFAASATTVTEDAGNNTFCPLSIKTVNIPVVIQGPALTGGDATATVTVTGGSAVAGRDYTLGTTTVTFPAGSSTSQNVTLTIVDNGSVDTNETINLHLAISANGSNATPATVLQDNVITILNNDIAPEAGGDVQSGTFSANATCNYTSPFPGMAKSSRTQYLITAAEMQAMGIKPGLPIKGVAFNVVQKTSTLPFNGYSLKMGNTSISDLATTFVNSPMIQAYLGNYTTTSGWNNIDFSSNFSWDGTSNVVIQICFTSSTSSPGNDLVQGYNAGTYLCAYSSTSNNLNPGCSLPHNSVSSARPVFRFTQTVPSTPVATQQGATGEWIVSAGQNVYFYNQAADTEVIAQIKEPSQNLGCTQAQVTQQGNGFTPASFAAVNRSLKEFSLTPSQNAAGTTFSGSFFFLNSELGGANLSDIRIVNTTAATDGSINGSNTSIVTPVVTQGTLTTFFTGSFNHFSRFFLTDQPFTVGVEEVLGQNGQIKVLNNPFHDRINIAYDLPTGSPATIRLNDLAGRCLYTSEEKLQPGKHQFSIEVPGALATGNYILQIVTPQSVINHKLLHQ